MPIDLGKGATVTSAKKLTCICSAGLSALALTAVGVATTSPAAQAADWSACAHGTPGRQAVFSRAAAVSGVPEKVLLGVSYLESRWDNHGGSPSTSGGYGPMDLTVRHGVGAAPRLSGRGEPSATSTKTWGTLPLAAQLTGLAEARLRSNAAANICGGAAVLASYQPHTTAGSPSAWSAAVARFSGGQSQADALQFADQVFSAIRSGEARVTNDGQRVTLPATPNAQVDTAAVRSLGLAKGGSSGQVDCPKTLACQWVPAPYEWYAPDKGPGWYGNHDLADRPHDMKIDYIIIHDTESSYDTALQLVQDPTYLAWNYTIRSSDGHVAQHLHANDIGWHAGNWYVNMHSLGVEHEGYAAQGATWYTEAMYETSAALVRYLAHEYGVPLDRAHIIGHDQVPGITPAYVAGMHWDPGPYWDWSHYMALLGAPLTANGQTGSDVVTVAPDFATNQQPVTGCDGNADDPCPAQGTNFVYVHQGPSESSPLVTDAGLHPDGSHSTTYVSDWAARAAAGQKLVVATRAPGWLGVWWSGQLGWIKSTDAVGAPVVEPSTGTLVRTAGDQAVPVYGRAYPEQSAYDPYGGNIPVQSVVPLQYSIQPGQAYVLAQQDVPTDYYYAKTYNCAYAVDDCTVVRGADKYDEIWFGHRVAYVRAADVRLTRP
jgi:hypothetical protein